METGKQVMTEAENCTVKFRTQKKSLALTIGQLGKP